jgi:hypothetical protein
MTTRKNLRARQKRAKQRAHQRQIAAAELARAVAQAEAAVTLNALERANRELAGKVLVVLTFTAENNYDSNELWYRLRTKPYVWRSRVGLLPLGSPQEVAHGLPASDLRSVPDPEALELNIRQTLGSRMGAALLKEMQPVKVRV